MMSEADFNVDVVTPHSTRELVLGVSYVLHCLPQMRVTKSLKQTALSQIFLV